MARGSLGNRFVKLWVSATASALSTGLITVAAPLLVASYTNSPLAISGAFVAAWLPWLLFALPGGVLVDRVDRRRLMVGLDWARAGALGVLALAIATGVSGVVVAYGVLFVVNSCEIVGRSASQAMVPALVGGDQLERANGRLVGSVTLMQGLVAGPLGGLLFVMAAALPFLAGAGAFAVSALLLMILTGTYRPIRAAPVAGAPASGRSRAVWREMVEAFAWLMRQRMLRTMAVLIGLLNLTLTAATAVLVLLAKDRLGLDSVGYGLLFTAMGVGGILGSVLGDRIIRWATPTWTIRIGLLIEASLHLALASSRDAVLIGVMFVAFGVHGSLWSIVGSSLRQRLTPPHMLGRVGSTTLFIAAGGNCVGALLGGSLASIAGLTAPYWAGFVVAILVAASTWHVFSRQAVRDAYAQAPTTPPTPVAA